MLLPELVGHLGKTYGFVDGRAQKILHSNPPRPIVCGPFASVINFFRPGYSCHELLLVRPLGVRVGFNRFPSNSVGGIYVVCDQREVRDDDFCDGGGFLKRGLEVARAEGISFDGVFAGKDIWGFYGYLNEPETPEGLDQLVEKVHRSSRILWGYPVVRKEAPVGALTQ